MGSWVPQKWGLTKLTLGPKPLSSNDPTACRRKGTALLRRSVEKVIKESNSHWSSPAILVAKKNGEVQFCVDYKRLNSLTRKDSYPLPNVYDR
jgi:hypothetical protein